MNDSKAAGLALRPGGWPEVFVVFLRLGLTSFGGPIAHLGYFRQALVVRRQWLSEAAYADLVALCQFLPGPTSSQVGLAIGLGRAGPLGALAAWVGFTLPSALLLTVFAFGADLMRGAVGGGLAHGLKLVAVAIVAQAVWGMAKTLIPDVQRTAIALSAIAVVTVASAVGGQVAAIGIGGLTGLLFCRGGVVWGPAAPAFNVSPIVAVACLVLYAIMLGGCELIATSTQASPLAYWGAFYRSGALVFGGGHVVLPLLNAAVVEPGWVDADSFLTGYGAAQAMPGPLFAFAAYLGAAMHAPPNGAAGAMLALTAIFLPGMLILLAVLPFWNALRARPAMQAAMSGANAAVVGILAAALYDPVWTSAVRDRLDFAAVAAGFGFLTAFRAPPVAVVAAGACFGVAKAFWG